MHADPAQAGEQGAARRKRRSHAGKSGTTAGLIALLFLAAFFGAAVPLFGPLVPIVVVLAGLSLWVLLDFRAGVGCAVVLMPLSALTFFPHELLGIRGLNPLNLILILTIISYVAHAGLRRWRDPLVPLRLAWYVVPIGIAAVVGMAHVGLIPRRCDTQPHMIPLSQPQTLTHPQHRVRRRQPTPAPQVTHLRPRHPTPPPQIPPRQAPYSQQLLHDP